MSSPPTPSKVFVSTITSTFHFQCHINLPVLASIITAPFTKKKSLKSFHNQLAYSYNHLDFKIFNNGNVVIVGSKTHEEPIEPLKTLYELLTKSRPITYSFDYSTVRTKLVAITHNHSLSELLNAIIKSLSPQETDKPIKLYTTNPQLLFKVLVLLDIYRTYYDYEVSINLPTLPFTIPEITNPTTLMLPCSISTPTPPTIERLSLSLIDCSFHSHFPIILQKYSTILKSNGFHVCNNISSHKGINSKLLCPIDCTEQTHSMKQLPNGKYVANCRCHVITVLVFRLGTHIITACNSWEQVRYTYDILGKLLKENYNTINDVDNPIVYSPDKIIKTYNNTEIILLKKGTLKKS